MSDHEHAFQYRYEAFDDFMEDLDRSEIIERVAVFEKFISKLLENKHT